jgi:hypothetical protein
MLVLSNSLPVLPDQNIRGWSVVLTWGVKEPPRSSQIDERNGNTKCQDKEKEEIAALNE